MSLVRVWTDVGARKPKPLLAKIVSSKNGIHSIRYLSPSADNTRIFRYEEDIYEIDDESICEYLNLDDEADIGFRINEEGDFYKASSDDDYEPSEEEDETTSDDDDLDDENEEQAEDFETEEEEEEEDGEEE
jgi:hypothetical protein